MACSKDMPDLDYTPSNAEIQRLPEAGGWNDLLDADATSRTIPRGPDSSFALRSRRFSAACAHAGSSRSFGYALTFNFQPSLSRVYKRSCTITVCS